MLKPFFAVVFLAAPIALFAQPKVPYKEAHQNPAPIIAPDGKVVLTYRESQAMSSPSWLNEHPDVKHLLIGRKRLFSGDYQSAIWNFDRAGYFGDKLAQAMLAEMYWEGKGTSVDRVRAYALADVAAERMNDPFLLRIRETYWEGLTPAERAAVEQIADEILGRYSDEVTLLKLQQHWRNRKQYFMTKGSGRLIRGMIVYNHENGSVDDDYSPSAYYARKFWDVREYKTFKDDFTAAATRYGKVSVKFGGKTQTSRVSTKDKSFLDDIEVEDDGKDYVDDDEIAPTQPPSN